MMCMAAAVSQLLSGNQFERAAGLVLAPDMVSLWLVDVYQHIYRFIVSVATALEKPGPFRTLRDLVPFSALATTFS